MSPALTDLVLALGKDPLESAEDATSPCPRLLVLPVALICATAVFFFFCGNREWGKKTSATQSD